MQAFSFYKAPEALRNSRDRKSTRLNSSHSQISYAVFCLKKKKHAHLLNRLLHISARGPSQWQWRVRVKDIRRLPESTVVAHARLYVQHTRTFRTCTLQVS